jgi:PIF1-like helicase
MWRILGYPLHGHSPAVQRLQVHLPGQHNVTYADLLCFARRNNDNQLMAYFKLNQEDKDAHKYSYADIPEHYTYDQNNRKWDTRKQKNIFKIARTYFVQPKDGERFRLPSLATFPTMSQDISYIILRYIPKSASDHSDKSREKLAKLAGSHIQALNVEQREIFDTIVASVSISVCPRKTNLYFIDGPGGTGKSFLYNTPIEQISGVMKNNVVVLASSGIAALILHSGRTAHSVFNVPIPVFKDSTSNITRGQQVGSIIHAANLIIWDEAPMMHRHVF